MSIHCCTDSRKTHAASIAIMAAVYVGLLFFGTTPAAIYVLMAIVGIGWASMVSLPFAIMSPKSAWLSAEPGTRAPCS